MHEGSFAQELLLLPMPARVERLGGSVDVPERFTVRGVDSALAGQTLGERAVRVDFGDRAPMVSCEVETQADVPPIPVELQRYALEISETGDDRISPIRIRAASRAALRHALHTLAQILRQYDDVVPAMAIADGPSFATRGVMLDVSRDRVPRMGHLFEIVDLIASLKFNHLQLYTEHTFAYEGHQAVWGGWSPVTGDEVRRLDDYCRARGIELAANQNCFGHLTKWLETPGYSHLAETTGEWMFEKWARSGPFSLCPTDGRSVDFVRGLLGELLPNFSSPTVNIGCDETYDIAFGRSKPEVERRGRAAVYMDFVNKVCQIARMAGKRPQFWADIALSHPEAIEMIPRDAVALAWGYEADSPFDRWCNALRGAEVAAALPRPVMVGHREMWVCPGTSSWRSITGRTSDRFANIVSAAKQGARAGASGLMVCDWGDVGHRQQWAISMHALAHAAQAAWNAELAEKFDSRASSLHVFNDVTLSVGAWLDRLGDSDKELRAIAGRYSHPEETGEFKLRNATALFADLHCGLGNLLDVGSVQQWEGVLKRIVDLSESVPAGLNKQVSDELRHTCAVARVAAGRAAARRRPGGLEDRFRKVLCERLREVIAEHERLWMMRSRPGGLAHSTSYYVNTLAELEGAGA